MTCPDPSRRNRIYKVARIGTKDVTVEEAETPFLAGLKAGWAPELCEAIDITAQVKRLIEIGDLRIVEGPSLEIEA